MTIIIGEVTPVIDTGIRKVCKKPYAGHPKGCPNWNKEGRFDCPPKAPPLHRVIDLEKTVFAVVSAFDIGSHILRMKSKHPDWTDRQLRNVLYWQGTARKKLRGGIAQLVAEHGGLVVLTCPEACGLMVTKTVEPLGVTLSWPPLETVHHVALAGTPLPTLRERYPEYCESKAVIFGPKQKREAPAEKTRSPKQCLLFS